MIVQSFGREILAESSREKGEPLIAEPFEHLHGEKADCLVAVSVMFFVVPIVAPDTCKRHLAPRDRAFRNASKGDIDLD
jgi:hypothetical protein